MDQERRILQALKEEIGEDKIFKRFKQGMNPSYNYYVYEGDNITGIRLCHSQLKEIPLCIFELTALKNLNLGNNKLNSIPNKISQLKELEILNLRYNNLKALPEEVLELENLKEIDIRENKIESTEIIKELERKMPVMGKKITIKIDDEISNNLSDVQLTASSKEIIKKIPEKKVYISYKRGMSEEILSQLEKELTAKGITLIIDKKDIDYKESIENFMEQLGRGKCVIVIISKKYLESESCMRELLLIAKNGKFNERVFPIVLDDAKIYDATEYDEYIRYWDKKFSEYNKKVLPDNWKIFRGKMDKCVEIKNILTEISTNLKDPNALTAQEHIDSRFKKIIHSIETYFDSLHLIETYFDSY